MDIFFTASFQTTFQLELDTQEIALKNNPKYFRWHWQDWAIPAYSSCSGSVLLQVFIFPLC